MAKLYENVWTENLFTEEELRKDFEESKKDYPDGFDYDTFEDWLEAETDMGGNLITHELESDELADAIIAARDDNLYGYIADNYWKLTNYELKEIALMAVATIIEENPESKQALIENMVERFQD